MGNTSAVTVRGLRKAYKGHQAVDGVDLDVEVAEILALLGPNGAGKTTTVEILEGFRKRDAGTVTVLGKDPDNSKKGRWRENEKGRWRENEKGRWRENEKGRWRDEEKSHGRAEKSHGRAERNWRARVGIVAQSAGSIPELTVAEIVRHFAIFYPHAKDPDEVIERTGLGEQRNKRVATLSGGQQRRLDVALAIVGDPELLFLDEPTTGFDPAARRQFWQLVKDLNNDGTTILLTTHYLEEAEALATRIAVMARGRIVAQGTPETLGGRETAAAHVSWDGPGGRNTLVTRTPTEAIRELAATTDGEIPGLTVTRPTLEDVYLALTSENAQTENALTAQDENAQTREEARR
jgi:ABC-2 type transport system ATP-binding protein